MVNRFLAARFKDMNATFVLEAEPGLTGFKLRKEGERWEREFLSVPQAVSYARSIATEVGKIIVMNWMGRQVAEMDVEPILCRPE